MRLGEKYWLLVIGILIAINSSDWNNRARTKIANEKVLIASTYREELS